MPPPYVGVAGWQLSRDAKPHFSDEGTHLQRYAGRLNAVEVNTSFYRSHQYKTWTRWGESVPEGFRFAVKMPREVTHRARLAGAEPAVLDFLDEIANLGPRLGCILVQLPPSLGFDPTVAEPFLAFLRGAHEGDVVLEPRHASWFSDGVDRLLADHRVARVAADPAVVPAAREPGGWDGLVYYRLHGSPRMYHSAYEDEALDDVAQRLAAAHADGVPAWCVFDNTASGAAIENALDVATRLEDEA